MTTTYQTRFIERLPRTPSSVSYRFERPEGFHFTAGQYMLVNLAEKLSHPLSLSDCPEETGFIEFTKRMTGSPYCRKLESLEPGDGVIVRGPSGNFLCDETDSTVVLIAGGIGITPIRSILKSLAEKSGKRCNAILIYGNLNGEDIAFRDELESLKLPGYRLVHVLSETSGVPGALQGFITADIIAKEVPDYRNANFMISGPPAMVEAIRKALATIAVPEERIRTDRFLGYD